MKDRVLTGLIAVVLLIQLWLVYRQYRPPVAPHTAPVQDVHDLEMDLGGLPLLGNKSAKVALVEFSDFECPFCQRYATSVGQEVRTRFVSPGYVLYAFANNPLPIHSNAKLLASSALCVGADRFWEMHDLIFRRQLKTMEEVLSVGKDLGLDDSVFRQCIEAGDVPTLRIAEDMKWAKRLGLNGTPAFAVGVMGNDRLAIQKIIVGAQPFEVFERTVNAVLKNSGAKVQIQ